MPSSLTVNLSSALVFSTRPPVSVYGTGPSVSDDTRGFSREPAPQPLSLRACASCTVRSRPPRFRRGVEPTSLQRAIPSARGLFASPSPLYLDLPGLRNIDRMSIHLSIMERVRSRLTLNRLALFRNPWSSGEGVSRPLCRYLYLHLLFRTLQDISRYPFAASGMLPYQSAYADSTSSAPDLCPIIIHAGSLD